MSARCPCEGAPRVLLEDVVDGLDGVDTAVDGAQPYVLPADGGAQGYADRPHLALSAQLLELGEEIVALHIGEPRVVQFIEVDAVGAETAQAGLERPPA